MSAMQPDLDRARAKARDMAYGLGIPLYLAPDGAVRQQPPAGAEGWERIAPPGNALPVPHAHGRMSAVASAP